MVKKYIYNIVFIIYIVQKNTEYRSMKKTIFVLIVGLFCISISGASASEESVNISLISASDAEYMIIPAAIDSNSVGIRTVTDTITQGETNWHAKQVNTYTQNLLIDLNWGDTSDSLRLKVYNPSNTLIGTFYDSADGQKNGRIRIYLKNSNGIPQGTWNYQVYGYSVSGVEDYTI